MNGLELPRHMRKYGYPPKAVHYRHGVVVSYHFQLPERLTLSVAFNWGNYTNIRDSWESNRMESPYFGEGLKRDSLLRIAYNAEIAIWNTHRQWLVFDNGDNVKGWVHFEEMPRIVETYLNTPRQWFDYRLFELGQVKRMEEYESGVWGMAFAETGKRRLW